MICMFILADALEDGKLHAGAFFISSFLLSPRVQLETDVTIKNNTIICL